MEKVTYWEIKKLLPSKTDMPSSFCPLGIPSYPGFIMATDPLAFYLVSAALDLVDQLWPRGSVLTHQRLETLLQEPAQRAHCLSLGEGTTPAAQPEALLPRLQRGGSARPSVS